MKILDGLMFWMFFIDMVGLKYQDKTSIYIIVIQTQDKYNALTYLKCKDVMIIRGGLLSLLI